MNWRYYFRDHQNKGEAFKQALRVRGWEQTTSPQDACFFLTDADVYNIGETVKTFHGMGKPSFIYPHAARPDLIGDFPGSEPNPCTTAHFVSAEGHVEIMRSFGYPHPLHVIGWTYCPIKPFEPRRRVRNVLFAPIHPSPTGTLSPIDRGLNQGAYNKLLPLAESGHIALTVRFLYNLKWNGLDEVSNAVQYEKGAPNLSFAMIDAADVVVSHQTFAHIAIARGVPTVMMGEWLRPRYTLTDGTTRYAKSFDRYKSLLMYPLDILDHPDQPVMELLTLASRSDAVIRDWRERMIGEPFNGDHFVDVIESYL